MTLFFCSSRGRYSQTNSRLRIFGKLNLETLEDRINPSVGFGFAIGGDTSGSDFAQATATDASGNIYMTGSFSGTVHFGSTTLTAQGTQDGFVAKFSPSGSFLWVADLGGSASGDKVISNAIAVDGSGDVYTTGYFLGDNVNFDPNSTNHQFSSSWNGQNDDAFVLKLNTSGQYVWAGDLGRTTSPFSGTNGYAITLDSAGNVYTAGTFDGTENFDPNSGNHQISSSLGDIDAYVSELNSSGQYIWAADIVAGASGGHSTTVSGIAVDGAGNIYTTGWFEGDTANFNPNGNYMLTSRGNVNSYISKLSSTKQFDWAEDIGYSGLAETSAIAVDASGDVYTTGDFFGSANFDPNGNYVLPDPDGSPGFVSELNSSGQFVLAVAFGGLTGGSAQGEAIAVDGSGDIYTTGNFNGTVNFDPNSGNHDFTGTDFGQDLNGYFSELNSSGQYIFAGVVGSGGGDGYGPLPTTGYGIALDGSGNIDIVGELRGANVNIDPLGTLDLSSSSINSPAYFVTQLTQSAPAVPTVTLNPSDATVAAGANASFASAAIGAPTPTEQWQVSTNGGQTFNNLSNGGVYSGATTAALSITDATLAMNAYEYRDVFTNVNGAATTTAATLTIASPPTVTTDPSNTTVNAGGDTAFTAAAADGFPVPTTVQWQISTNGGETFSNLSNGGVYSGVSTTTLTITGAQVSQNTDEYQAVFSNSADLSATTTAATLTVDFAPSVTTNPTNATANADSNASFTAAATGNPAPTVQWQVSTNGGATFSNVGNGGVYSGATTLTLSITGALAAMNGYEYQAVFSNTLLGAGSQSTATTTAATLTVDFAPTVTTNPSNATTNAGSNASFTAVATGIPAPTVQWQVSGNGGATFTHISNGGVYSGATTATLTITGATAAMDGYEYEAVFSNTLFGASIPSTATTSSAALTVDFAPIVTTNPTNEGVTTGGNTSFTAAATGNPLPTVQWQVSTDGGATFIDLANGGVYSGATTPALSITGAISTMNGYEYEAVFSNTLFGAGSPSTATTTAATLTIGFAPTVTTNPGSTTVNSGASTAFTAAATDGYPVPTAVQWQISTNGGSTFANVANGGVFSGATTTTLTITGALASQNADEFRVIFSNSANFSATTTAATLTVDFAPTVTTNPSNETVNAGLNTSFTAAATGNPTPTVQWLVSTNGGTTFNNVTNGGAYSGATSATLSITGATAAMNEYQYEAVFSNTLAGAGSPTSATSSPASLTVDLAPAVTANPSSSTINAGSNTSFTAAATGNPLPAVQWQVSTNGGVTFSTVTNGGVYSGAATTTLNITGATAAMNGYIYQAAFSNTLNGAGSPSTATTTTATLTVDFAPTVATNPANAAALVNGTATFAASAVGNPAPTIQWQVSTNGGAAFTNLANGGNYSGVNTGVLTVSGVSLGLNGFQYRAVFTNGVGSPVQTSVAVLSTIFQSQYVGQAYNYTYAAYIYAFDAYVTGQGSYNAFYYEYYADYYAQYADSYSAADNQSASQYFAYYAYYYGYYGQYYAYQDYAQSGGASIYSYYTYLDGYYGQFYSYYTAAGY